MKKFSLFAFLVLVLVSCKTPTDIAYFQDIKALESAMNLPNSKTTVVQPGDKVMIVVHSRDPQLATLYNLPIVGTRVGMTTNSGYSNYSTMPYIVDSEGCIDFPVLGSIKISGLKRDQVAALIKNELVSKNLCNDAVVNVELDNVYINVLGEVTRPGRYALTKDRISVLDAIGMAGDLTLQGQRYNVVVLREENGQAKIHKINMLDFSQMSQSPAYYLQQDDVVYVEPNDMRKRQTTVNGNNVLSTSFWISCTSLLMSIAVFVVNVVK